MQAAHPSFRLLSHRSDPGRSDSGRSDSGAATPQTVRDDEIEPERELDEASEPSERPDLTERVAAALSASARAEANLRALFRTVKFLGASVGTARQANEQLLGELSALHGALVSECESESPQERARAWLLEQALMEANEQAVREREFLIAEHDAFIASLIGDHEQEIETLRRRVAEAEAKLAAREAQDFDRDWSGD